MRLPIADWRLAIWLASLMGLATGCSPNAGLNPVGPGSASRPGASRDSNDSWKEIADALGKGGELRDGVYTVVVPRDDLSVTIEGMDVPTAAGIFSTFRFYQCSCGKTAVLGEFVVADYEANDVAYALQKQDILVSSIGPYLLYEKPRLMVVRFQAEGTPRHLAEAIRTALDWTGRNRMAPQKGTPPG